MKLCERWLLFILIQVEALLICRHQGSGCCFSCTVKFHRNRFSCPTCQGRSFILFSFNLPCWTIYTHWSLTVSLTTQQVELCSEGNSWRQSTRTGRISPGCWTPICTLELPDGLGEQPLAVYKAIVLSLVNYALCVLSELKLFTVYLTYRSTPFTSRESITLSFSCCLVANIVSEFFFFFFFCLK